MPIFTAGHSNVPIETFVGLLQLHHIDLLMDVRSHPGSRHCPHFNRLPLAASLAAAGVDYEWAPDLGGWSDAHRAWAAPMAERGIDITGYLHGVFPKQIIARKLKPDPGHPSWTNLGLLHYSFFSATDVFARGARRLIEVSLTCRVAILCSEVLFWKCHRSMIADYLVWAGHDPYHLQPKLTRHADAIGNRLRRYDPVVVQAWEAGGLSL